MLNSTTANMYPWYRDSMSQLGQFCNASIKTENGYGAGAAAAADQSCMLAIDYAQNKVRIRIDVYPYSQKIMEGWLMGTLMIRSIGRKLEPVF